MPVVVSINAVQPAMRSSRLKFPTALHFVAKGDWARALGIDAGNTAINVINAVAAHALQLAFVTSSPPTLARAYYPGSRLRYNSSLRGEWSGRSVIAGGYVASEVVAASRAS